MLSHDALTCLSRGYRNLYSRTPGITSSNSTGLVNEIFSRSAVSLDATLVDHQCAAFNDLMQCWLAANYRTGGARELLLLSRRT